jgi:hypothetical protein
MMELSRDPVAGEKLSPLFSYGKSFTRTSINVYDKKLRYKEEGWNHS